MSCPRVVWVGRDSLGDFLTTGNRPVYSADKDEYETEAENTFLLLVGTLECLVGNAIPSSGPILVKLTIQKEELYDLGQ